MTRAVATIAVLLLIGDIAPAFARALPGGRHSSLGTTLDSVKAKRKTRKSRKRRYRRRHRRSSKFVQLKDGPGLKIRRSRYAWGTQLTTTHLSSVFAAFNRHAPNAHPFWIHDISKRRGGKLGPHLSHRRGTDVDIRLPHKKYSRHYRKATPRTLHVAHTWFVINRLIQTGDVEYIFIDKRLQRALYRFARKQGLSRAYLRKLFQYPKGYGGIVRHWPGHKDHMHVRFRRGKLRALPSSLFAEAQCLVSGDGHPMYQGTGS